MDEIEGIMKTSSAKAKGRRLQNFISEQFNSWLNGMTGTRPAIMGESGMDVKVEGVFRPLIPWSVEAKNTEKINIWAALAQAEANAGDGIPIVVFKRNRQDPQVAMSWATFEKIGQFIANNPAEFDDYRREV